MGPHLSVGHPTIPLDEVRQLLLQFKNMKWPGQTDAFIAKQVISAEDIGCFFCVNMNAAYALESLFKPSLGTKKQVTFDIFSKKVEVLCSGNVKEKLKMLFMRSNQVMDERLERSEIQFMFEMILSVIAATAEVPMLRDMIAEKKGKEQELADETMAEIAVAAGKKPTDYVPVTESRFLVWAEKAPIIHAFFEGLRSFRLSSRRTRFARLPGDDKYRILCLDGGGVRGAITAHVLERIETQFPGFLDSFDLIAGNSTGSIIAGLLAVEYPIRDVVNLYEYRAKLLFGQKTFPVKDFAKLFLSHTYSCLGSQYSPRAFIHTVKGIGGDIKLGSVKKKILIPTFSLSKPTLLQGREGDVIKNHYGPKIYHNYRRTNKNEEETKEEDAMLEEKMIDLILRSAAAPTYFPAHEGSVDGGLVCNNPSSAALCQAISPEYGNVDIKKIRIFSVGTSVFPTTHNGSVKGKEVEKLVQMFLEGTTQFGDETCKILLGNRYHRLQPLLETFVDLDDVSDAAFRIMSETASSVNLDNAYKWIADEWLGDLYKKSAAPNPLNRGPRAPSVGPTNFRGSSGWQSSPFDLDSTIKLGAHVILLFLMFTKEQIKEMNTFSENHADKGLQVVGLHTDDKFVINLMAASHLGPFKFYALGDKNAAGAWIDVVGTKDPRCVIVTCDGFISWHGEVADSALSSELKKALDYLAAVEGPRKVEKDQKTASAEKKDGKEEVRENEAQATEKEKKATASKEAGKEKDKEEGKENKEVQPAEKEQKSESAKEAGKKKGKGKAKESEAQALKKDEDKPHEKEPAIVTSETQATESAKGKEKSERKETGKSEKEEGEKNERKAKKEKKEKKEKKDTAEKSAESKPKEAETSEPEQRVDVETS